MNFDVCMKKATLPKRYFYSTWAGMEVVKVRLERSEREETIVDDSSR